SAPGHHFFYCLLVNPAKYADSICNQYCFPHSMADGKDLTFFIDDMSHTDIAVQFNESFERCVNNPLF
ncbi:MAG: hypothetical protein KAR12_09690, partial [Methylococcales bacterium]|nr:hypothetical protein [Methylococcales bacterium]